MDKAVTTTIDAYLAGRRAAAEEGIKFAQAQFEAQGALMSGRAQAIHCAALAAVAKDEIQRVTGIHAAALGRRHSNRFSCVNCGAPWETTCSYCGSAS